MSGALFSAQAEKFSDESVNYNIYFKVGFIHKQAGRAKLILQNDGNRYSVALYARTEPWADRFYRVRDTLLSSFDIHTLAPVRYQRIAHEGGRYAWDIIRFSHDGNTVNGDCKRYRRGKKDKETSESTLSLTAQGVTVDLLSSFYYIRSFDYLSLKPGDTRTVNIFSGKRKELLKITYLGKETIKINKEKVDTYKINFTFTSEGKKKTSDPIEAWLSISPGHIPLKLVGHLKIGQIQCFYAP